MSFIAELRRRNVLRMAGLYLVGAWLIVQVSGTILPLYGAPAWLPRSIVTLLAIGFVPALVFAWVFELTPAGLKRDADVRPEDSIAPRTARHMDRMLVVVLTLALAYFGFDKFVLAPRRDADLVAQTRAAAEETVTHRPPATNPKSIAVLPFTDLSPEQDQEYFSDGISEEILNALAQISDLRVAGRTSSFSFKGRNENLREIGRTLAVAHVLEGSVRKQGDRVRITAQLIRTADDTHLWSQTYDGDLADVFALQERVARAITDQLQLVLQGEQKTRLVPVATSDPQAYLLYLKASEIFSRRDGTRFPEAISSLQEAIRLDPGYARAHARLAAVYSVASTYSALDFAETYAASEREARLSIELDPGLAEAHAVLGLVHSNQRNWQAALEPQELAVALDAADANARFWYATSQLNLGYRTQGIASLDQALAIDPLLPTALRWRGVAWREQGKPEMARRLLRQSVDAGQAVGNIWLALISHDEGNDADAIDYFTRGAGLFLEGFPDGASRTLAQGVFGEDAARAKAIAMLDAYVATKPKTLSGTVPWALILLGQPARALALAQDAPTTNDALVFVTLWSPEGRDARRLPQFAEFARRTNLAGFWDQHGPPDLCRRAANADYVCE